MNKNKVRIRQFELNDIDNKIEWINNPENNRYLHYDLPLEKEKTINWFLNKDNSTRDDYTILYDDTPVGVIGLLNIDFNNLKAEYYITLGSIEHKRKGISSQATEILLKIAFEDMNLNKVYLNVDAENKSACTFYEKNNFICEGYFKEDIKHRGRLVDRKRYAIFSKDFKDL